jgi:hypothetical protein
LQIFLFLFRISFFANQKEEEGGKKAFAVWIYRGQTKKWKRTMNLIKESNHRKGTHQPPKTASQIIESVLSL